MATKKPVVKPAAKKSTAVAVAPVREVALPTDYNDKRAEAKARFMSTIAANSGEMNKIAVSQDKKFNVPVEGDTEKVDEVSGIIVAFTARKNYYEGAYVKGENSPPNCFAIGDDSFDNLIPSPNSPDCQAQTCGTCALNKFEKDAKGKWLPKGCKDSFRLALVAPGQDKLMTLDLSSTATKDFVDYVKSIYKLGKDFNEVITEFFFDPSNDYPSVRCRNVGDVPAKAKGLIASLEDEAVGLISKEPNVEEFEEKVAAKRLPAPKKKRAA